MKRLQAISPYIRRAWDGHMLPGWSVGERVLFDYEFVYIMEGAADIRIEDRQYRAAPGELYFFRPGVRHAMRTAERSLLRQPHIHFDLFYRPDSELVNICYRPLERIKPEETGLFREQAGTAGLLPLPERIRLQDRGEVERLLFAIIREQERSDEYAGLSGKAYFIQLLVHLLKEAHGRLDNLPASMSPLGREKINTVGEYIRLHFLAAMDLDRLAAVAGLSKSHLLRQFKQVFGISPLQYQMNLRIGRAKQMLSTSQSNVSEIASYLGFADVQHFSKVFRRKTGLSPTAFRQLHDAR